MRDRAWGWLGLACLVGMVVRAAWVTRSFDWPMNALAVVAGLALILSEQREKNLPSRSSSSFRSGSDGGQ